MFIRQTSLIFRKVEHSNPRPPRREAPSLHRKNNQGSHLVEGVSPGSGPLPQIIHHRNLPFIGIIHNRPFPIRAGAHPERSTPQQNQIAHLPFGRVIET